ncbi:hemerythrin domain-containing protein [Nocardia cyriacigeorgica]|uniref:hemerythrin domain-containing protein n=1 Tax=Nocardia cyriacigeorgica TaxID=135487 RepID=UPI0018932FD7|nr:hemerythrin domain-containing protein [Nocardia cyriacigeorgica]MBF6317327.1 hemerythrin domain-containing protein [Nocardia cyriacigeorgica]MBF6345328.1 hemerythrin domain-containing protein [Nocardia cyriacigeorgica]MBF6514306.1 hemerythrin domain-containing protein [Nocardia cyriacigeorgica]MBF6532121.1 hemerythrin domain-containing protein [Nocardia cyriacigeorgica]
MDALAFLRTDHESVLGMIETLERGRGTSAADLEARKDLATSLVMAASQHEAVEEQYFWPEVRRALPDGDELADHALRQEDSAKHLLQKIDNTEAGSAEFERALNLFIVGVREHIEFEQNQVWPRMRQSAPAQTLDELGDRMALAKKTAPTRPRPATPSTGGAQKSAGLAAAVLDKARDLLSGRRSHQPPEQPPT